MTVRFPEAPRKLGLGVGLDLPWGRGFVDDRAAEDVVAFLQRHAGDFQHLFVSWQPRDRGKLDAARYFDAFDDLFERIGDLYPVVALHQTALNLGAIERYDRRPLLALTRALVDRYGLAWVNEDVGLWSIHGKPLPYPLAPYLTRAGLASAVDNAREVQDAIGVPLLLEFPGFSDGTAIVVGRMHAYDFFRELAERTDAPVTLDTGHLLSYQWLRGRRGEDLFAELERLPLDQCFEIHLSGCAIEDGRFHDRHDGVLLEEQHAMLSRLLGLCRNVRAVTYEDPVFDREGRLGPETTSSFETLRTSARSWDRSAPYEIRANDAAPSLPPSPTSIDRVLHSLLFRKSFRARFVAGARAELGIDADDAAELESLDLDELESAARLACGAVLERTHRGVGSLSDAFPRSFEALRSSSLGANGDLATAFAESDAFGAWRPIGSSDGVSPPLEMAFAAFCAEVLDREGATVARDECAVALARTFIIDASPAFDSSPLFRRGPRGHYAVIERDGSPFLVAAVGERLVLGRITPLIAEVLLSKETAESNPAREAVQRELRTLGLL